jgi:hypothetical protein
MRRVALAAAIAFLAACVAHEKAGDQASSLGDWKGAEREYAQALKDDPGKKDIQAKYREARAQALAGAQRTAQACAVGRDWECALAESQYALGLDPGNQAMAALHRDAGREVGRLRLRRADEALDRGESARAMELIEAARAVTEDPGVEAEARRMVPAAVEAAVAESSRLRAARQYPQAIDLLSRAARLDPGVTPRLQATQAEYDQWKDYEAERLAREGDAFLRVRRFAEARDRYVQAATIQPESRARELARYADLMLDGDAAVARRDFPDAEAHYRRAL